jgi:hypothetical protein
MGVGISGRFLAGLCARTDPQNQGMRVWSRGINTSGFFFTTGLTHQLIFREEEEGRTNDSESLDEEVCTAQILFSSQVCAFISSRD